VAVSSAIRPTVRDLLLADAVITPTTYTVTDTMEAVCRVKLANVTDDKRYYLAGNNGTCDNCKFGCPFNDAGKLGKAGSSFCASTIVSKPCYVDLGLGAYINEVFANITAQGSPDVASIKASNKRLHFLSRYRFFKFGASGQLEMELGAAPQDLMGLSNFTHVDFNTIGSDPTFQMNALFYLQGVFFPAPLPFLGGPLP
jgi:hypothetical protein